MIRKIIIPITLATVILMLASCSKHPTTYYVSLSGNDENSGKSPENAWRTIQKVNDHDLAPGERILFLGGEEFNGTIILSHTDTGTPEKKVLISSYGKGKAVINGAAREGLRADSCHHLDIRNLEFKGSGRKDGNLTDGLLIRYSDFVMIDSIECHGFQHSGVHLQNCCDAKIVHTYAHDNGFAGIHVTGIHPNDPEIYENHNLYIGYCVAENNPGDPTVPDNHSGNGILASSVKNGIIEYCEAFNNGWDMIWTGNGPVGIWIWDCTQFTIQYCISHHNRTNPVAADGGGFDFDGGVSNSIIQYCISHHNEGAGYGLYEFGAAKPWENNILRYNISLNDGKLNAGSVGIWRGDNGGTIRNCEIYNNTFYNSNPNGYCIWLHNNYPGFRFRNNVLVYKKSFASEKVRLKDEIFQGNLYWNLEGITTFENYPDISRWAEATGKEIIENSLTGIYMDPMLTNPASLTLADPNGINPENLSSFFPLPGSPSIDKGLDINNLFGLDPGPHDLCGTKIPVNQRFDIGAIEYIVK